MKYVIFFLAFPLFAFGQVKGQLASKTDLALPGDEYYAKAYTDLERKIIETQAVEIKEIFERNEFLWPPKELCFVAYKRGFLPQESLTLARSDSDLMAAAEGLEQEPFLLVFAQTKTGTIKHVRELTSRLFLLRTIHAADTSGQLGPKDREGDGKVPEGRYSITDFNAQKGKYRAMRLNYPNAEDQARNPNGNSGGDILIHGDVETSGCVSLGGNIDRIFALANIAMLNGNRVVPVFIFPSPLPVQGAWGTRISTLIESSPHRAHWFTLQGKWASLFREDDPYGKRSLKVKTWKRDF